MKALQAIGVAGVMIFGMLAAQTAAAEQGLERVRTTTVRAADLDLTREDDARELYDRIRSAALRLCVAGEVSYDLRKASRRRSCIRAAVDGAVERANVPLLTAVHMEQSQGTRLTQLQARK